MTTLRPLTLVSMKQVYGGKHIYKLKLLAIFRLQRVSHVNTLRPCHSTYSLRHDVPVTTPECDDDELEVSKSHLCFMHQFVT
jgi:hypothetical protein